MNLKIVIPFFNGHKYIERLLESIPFDLPVIIVDDQSEKPLTLDQLTDDVRKERVTILRPAAKGYFTGACNYGIIAAGDSDVLILNQDTYFVNDEWRTFLEKNAPTYAMIGERIKGNHPAWPHGYIHGTFMFVRRDAIQKVGLMDAEMYPLWGSTCEWQLRFCRAGYAVSPLVDVPGFFHERGQRPYGESIEQLLKKEPAKKPWYTHTPPMISVIITCYNYGRFLRDAVNSLLGGPTDMGVLPPQTFQSFEIIIVDDASTDETEAIGRELADGWKGIRYIRHSKNAGSSAACNTGIERAYGEYIAILDGDDLMEHGRLERMVKAAIANPHTVVCDSLYRMRDGKIITNGSGNLYVWEVPTYNYDIITTKNTMHKGLLYPKQAWVDVGGYPASMQSGREDWAFNVALGLKGWCGTTVKEPGYIYRRHNKNRTDRNSTTEMRQQFLIQIMGLYPDAYKKERPAMCCGGSNKTSNSNGRSSARNANFMAGQEGFTVLEYIGGNAGDETWYGSVTKTRYKMGGSTTKKLVDNRDVPGFLGLMVGGNRRLFREAQVEAIHTMPAVEIVVDTANDLDAVLGNDGEGLVVEEVVASSEETAVIETGGDTVSPSEPTTKPARKKKNA